MKDRYKSPARHRSIEAMREHLQSLDPSFDLVDRVDPEGALAQPFQLGERTIGNRFCVHPMEGWDANRDGSPSALTKRRWRNFGKSGAKLVWGGEAFAVRADGRANPNQLYLTPNAEKGLVELREELLAGHREIGQDEKDLFVGLQLTHSGRFARPDGALAARIAYRHPVLDEKFAVTSDDAILSDAELEDIAALYVDAAELAQRAGYDFVDVKCCHGYLMHELLGAKTREGKYGGSFENRTALFRWIVDNIRQRCPGLEIGVRVSIVDTYPHKSAEDGIGAPVDWEQHLPYDFGFGVDRDDPREFELGEPKRFLELLRSLGITLVNLSIGSPYYCPHVQRPAAYPPGDGYGPPEDPLLSVLRHLRVTRQLKADFSDLALVGSGYTYLQDYLPHVGEFEVAGGHVDFVGLGRMMLIYHDLPLDVLQGRPLARKRICRTFSDCTTAPRNGMVSGCYPLDSFYKERPEFKELAAIKKAMKNG